MLVKALSGTAALLCWAGWEWIRRTRQRLPELPAPRLDRLDDSTRCMLRAVAAHEPFTLRDIDGLSVQSWLDCLDRLTANGYLKCEFTVLAGESDGAPIWTLYPEVRNELEPPRFR